MRALRSQLRTQVAVNRGGRDHARDADQGQPRGAPARRRRADRRHAARHADLPRGQRPRHLHRHRQVRQPERRLRPGVPRPAGEHRPAPGDDRPGAHLAGVEHPATSGASPRRAPSPIVPDTAAKRREYEEEIVRTFFLSNADLKETVDVLRIVVDARRLAPMAATNAITIKDTPERVAAAGRIITRHRQGPARGGDRRRAARGRSHAAEGLRAAGRQPRLARHRRLGDHRSDNPITLRDLTQPHASDVAAHQPAGPLLPAAQDRQQHAHPGQPAAAHLGGHRRPGALRRARAGAGHHLRADRRRRRADPADHLVQLREHRRQHRHHAAHAPRRRRVAGAEDRAQQHLRRRASATCRRSATARSPP